MKLPSFVSEILRKRRRLRLRLINKGYKKLKKENRLSTLKQLRDILSKTKLNNVNLLKGFDLSLELPIRQYLVEKIIYLSFHESILYGFGKNKAVRHPLPREWQDALITAGIPVDIFASTSLWYFHCFLYWGRGCTYGLISTLLLLRKRPKLGEYVYFSSIDENCISSSRNAHNIVNWYFKWCNKREGVESVCHSVKARPNFSLDTLKVIQTDGLPKLENFNILTYIFIANYLSFRSVFWLFTKPAYALFLVELIKYKRTELANTKDFAEDYLFPNTGPYYRPIWTYLAERKGSRILLYFYSTNIEDFRILNKVKQENPWHLSNWPHYLVWDEFQASFIKRINNRNPIIENVGPIWFSSYETSVEVPVESISVFDVTPFRPSIYIKLGIDHEYYTVSMANKFLSDVQCALNDNGLVMLHKMKRVNKLAHKIYIRKIAALGSQANYLEVNPSLDALKLIKKTKACISVPFTATALIAKSEGKPSVYYDPTGIIFKDDKAAHGIPVLNTVDELRSWVEHINNA
jgi:polysaccharide biosynthesis PFTS motif protein